MSNYEFVKNICVSSEDRVTSRLKFPMHDKEERGQVPPHKNIAVEKRTSHLEMRQGINQIPEETSIDKRMITTTNKM